MTDIEVKHLVWYGHVSGNEDIRLLNKSMQRCPSKQQECVESNEFMRSERGLMGYQTYVEVRHRATLSEVLKSIKTHTHTHTQNYICYNGLCY